MAFEKLEPPGCEILSPTCKPEIDSTIAVSRYRIPVTVILLLMYSFGAFAFPHSNRSGSTEVGLVVSGSCALTDCMNKDAITTTQKRSKYRCMVDCSISLTIFYFPLKQDSN